MTKLEYLLRQYDTVVGWYRQSEEKAKFLVTINTLAVGIVNGLVFVGAEKVGAVGRLYTIPIWLLLALSGAALVGSYISVLRAMWPRHHKRTASPKLSLRTWFFGDVASLTEQQHREALTNWTEDDLEATLIAQNYILSSNVWTKHEALNWAITLTIIALVLLFALGVAYGIVITSLSAL
jgi:hypothetical protein